MNPDPAFDRHPEVHRRRIAGSAQNAVTLFQIHIVDPGRRPHPARGIARHDRGAQLLYAVHIVIHHLLSHVHLDISAADIIFALLPCHLGIGRLVRLPSAVLKCLFKILHFRFPVQLVAVYAALHGDRLPSGRPKLPAGAHRVILIRQSVDKFLHRIFPQLQSILLIQRETAVLIQRNPVADHRRIHRNLFFSHLIDDPALLKGVHLLPQRQRILHPGSQLQIMITAFLRQRNLTAGLLHRTHDRRLGLLHRQDIHPLVHQLISLPGFDDSHLPFFLCMLPFVVQERKLRQNLRQRLPVIGNDRHQLRIFPMKKAVDPHPGVLLLLVDLQRLHEVKLITDLIRRNFVGIPVLIQNRKALVGKILHQFAVHIPDALSGTVDAVDPGAVGKGVMVVNGQSDVGSHQTDQNHA